MAKIKFDYSGVESCCAELESSLKRIRDIHDDCESEMSKIKSGSAWQGPASESLVEKYTKTINTCRTMEKSLQNIIKFIRESSSKYQKADNEVMERLKG